MIIYSNNKKIFQKFIEKIKHMWYYIIANVYKKNKYIKKGDQKMAYTASVIANWFLARNKEEESEGADMISNLKLQKLLYYAQGCTLAITDEPLFNDDIYAWKHGPVVESVYHNYKSFGSNGIEFNEPFDFKSICTKISDILESVYQTFGQFSAWKLRNMTHEETPWKNTVQGCVIDKDLIKLFFKENYIE